MEGLRWAYEWMRTAAFQPQDSHEAVAGTRRAVVGRPAAAMTMAAAMTTTTTTTTSDDGGGRAVPGLPGVARRLAHSDKSVRDAAVAELQKHLIENALQFTDLEFLKLWKGLFYAFWMSDKPMVQHDLAELLASTLSKLPGDEAIRYIRAFWETMAREWLNIDRLRIDKFYMLCRKVHCWSFRLMITRNWDAALLDRLCTVLADVPLCSDKHNIPDGLRYHTAEVLFEELAKALTQEGVNKLPQKAFNSISNIAFNALARSRVALVVSRLRENFLSLWKARDKTDDSEATSVQPSSIAKAGMTAEDLLTCLDTLIADPLTPSHNRKEMIKFSKRFVKLKGIEHVIAKSPNAPERPKGSVFGLPLAPALVKQQAKKRKRDRAWSRKEQNALGMDGDDEGGDDDGACCHEDHHGDNDDDDWVDVGDEFPKADDAVNKTGDVQPDVDLDTAKNSNVKMNKNTVKTDVKKDEVKAGNDDIAEPNISVVTRASNARQLLAKQVAASGWIIQDAKPSDALDAPLPKRARMEPESMDCDIQNDAIVASASLENTMPESSQSLDQIVTTEGAAGSQKRKSVVWDKKMHIRTFLKHKPIGPAPIRSASDTSAIPLLKPVLKASSLTHHQPIVSPEDLSLLYTDGLIGMGGVGNAKNKKNKNKKKKNKGKKN